MPYSPRITIEDYVLSMLRLDMANLPPQKSGCYSAWLADFAGDEPQPSDKDKLVYVGKTEKKRIAISRDWMRDRRDRNHRHGNSERHQAFIFPHWRARDILEARQCEG